MKQLLNNSLLKTIIYPQLRHRNYLFFQQTKKFSDQINTDENKESKLGGFAKAFEKYTAPPVEPVAEKPQTFASLLRNSKFIDV